MGDAPEGKGEVKQQLPRTLIKNKQTRIRRVQDEGELVNMEHGSMTPLYNGWPYNGVKSTQGNRGVKQAQRRTKEQEQEKKSDGWALSHPANGLLATLSEKGWPKRPFARAFSTQCSALSDFFTLFLG